MLKVRKGSQDGLVTAAFNVVFQTFLQRRKVMEESLFTDQCLKVKPYKNFKASKILTRT